MGNCLLTRTRSILKVISPAITPGNTSSWESRTFTWTPGINLSTYSTAIVGNTDILIQHCMIISVRVSIDDNSLRLNYISNSDATGQWQAEILLIS